MVPMGSHAGDGVVCCMTRGAKEHRRRKVKRIIRRATIFVVFTLIVAACWAIAASANRVFGAGTPIAVWINRHVMNYGGDANRFMQTAIIFILGFTIITLLQYVIRLFGLRGNQRYKTVITLIASLIKYIGAAIVLVLLLNAWAVDPTIIAAFIAALGLALGFGAQGLIGDMLSGLFLIFENALKVGDFILFDNFRGEVVEVGIRATRILSPAGDVKVINNSELRVFTNMSMHRSTAVCDIPIEYEEDLKRVEKLITDNLIAIGESIPAITDGPWFLGVKDFTDRGMLLRLVAKCSEDTRPQTARDLNKQIKALFDKNKIKIAVPRREMLTKNKK